MTLERSGFNTGMAGIGLPTTKWDENIIQAAPHILQLFYSYLYFWKFSQDILRST